MLFRSICAEMQECKYQYHVDGVDADGTFALKAKEIYTGEPEIITHGELLAIAG